VTAKVIFAMLISVHIPKCAGTGFQRVLHSLLGPGLWLNYGTIFARADARRELVPAGATCIHGHFFADAFDDLFPERQLITWVSHPVERVVSSYYDFLCQPDWGNYCCRVLWERQLTLRQFAELDWMRNKATRYLAGKPTDAFAFIGVTERCLDSLQAFGRTFAVPAPLPRRERFNPVRTAPRPELGDGDYEHLLALNAADLAWYWQAQARLENTLARMAPPSGLAEAGAGGCDRLAMAGPPDGGWWAGSSL